MIDGTAIVLLGTLVLVALCRAVYHQWYMRVWHQGRAALIREQEGARKLGVTVRYDAMTRPRVASFGRSEALLHDIYDQGDEP